MRYLRSIFLSLLFLSTLTTYDAFAQATRVKGMVLDASTGKGVPFAGIYFKNSTVGVSTDMDGRFAFETREDSLTVLTASCIGYKTLEA